MIRGLIRLVLLIVVIAAIGAFMLGWRWNGRVYHVEGPPAVGTSGIDRDKARATGAEIGDRAAKAADATRRAIGEGSLTAKIKAKMALDDHVKSLDLNVDTVGSVVTVRGVVHSEAERERALSLARDTEGVTQVVDRLQVKRE